MSRRGLFITFEGGEACGKSTQIPLLAERLREQGHSVLVLREPGGTPLGEKLRHLLKFDPDGRGMAAETELLLMNASRAELVHRVIRPALAAGSIVICDRFADSTLAYQGFGRGLRLDQVRSIISLAVGGVQPDLTLWLRVPEVEAARRVARRNGLQPSEAADRFEAESAAFFARVEQGYASLAAAEPTRFYAVEGLGDVAGVQERVWRVVASRVESLS